MSNVHWMALGEHCLPVISDEPAPEISSTLLFCRASSLIASATAVFGTSTSASTLSSAIQRRAMALPMSDLFWWSAVSSVTRTSGCVLVKSAIASCAATAEPRPEKSEYTPDMSVSRPILISFGAAPACPAASSPIAAVAASRPFLKRLMASSLFLFIPAACGPHVS